MKMLDANGQDEEILMEDRCVCCGEPVPEGWMVCYGCIIEKNYKKKVGKWYIKQLVIEWLRWLREQMNRFRRKK